ncbi:MAG TPA: cytochrome c oxidase subunit 3 [Steroidobacteraceae bacterium]|nr:cytochrome c oxidase subunit 3 [Steroidobacteraceae bacterium]
MTEVISAKRELMIATPEHLPVGPVGRHGNGMWGVGAMIASEAALFAYLLFAYFYTGATAPQGWLLEPAPTLKLALPNTILLLLSSVAAWWGERGVLRRRSIQALIGFFAAFVMGSAFVAVQWFEWQAKHYGLGTSSYSSLYFVTTGFHIAHVVIGLAVLFALFVWTALDYFSPRRRLAISAGVMYWHFVDIVWVFVFGTYYLTPYLGFAR